MAVQEQRSNGTSATYLTGPRGPECRIDETQPTGEMAYGPGGRAFQRGPTKWYVFDGLGSVVAEVDPAGTVTASEKYDAYGSLRGGSGGGTATTHHFVGSLGHMAEAGTGLVYMRARYYDPAQGRFISQDSKRNGDDWFAYCDNNPINNIDRDGKSFDPTTNQDDRFTEIGVGYFVLANAALLLAATCAVGPQRAIVVMAMITAMGGTMLIADALSDTVAPSGLAFTAFMFGASVALNQVFGMAGGKGSRVMQTLIPSVGNAIASVIATTMVAEVYM